MQGIQIGLHKTYVPKNATSGDKQKTNQDTPQLAVIITSSTPVIPLLPLSTPKALFPKLICYNLSCSYYAVISSKHFYASFS